MNVVDFVNRLPPHVVAWAGVLATTTGGAGVVAFSLGAQRGAIASARDRRFATLRKALVRAGLRDVKPEHVTLAQAAGFAVALGVAAWQGPLLAALLAFGTVMAPSTLIERARRERMKAIDAQLDSFLTKMANALRVTSSIGDALRWLETALEEPMRSEIAKTNRDMRLGQPLDGALLMLGERTGSGTLAAAITAILIARRTGGDLARNLDAMAASLREMGRLERVLSTKTAEGRVQLWVLGAVPFGLGALLEVFSPGYFAPVTQSFFGYVLAAVAGALWLVAIVVARRVLDVDL